MTTKEEIREVQTQEGYFPMMWLLPKLSVAQLVDEFEYLKGKYGLTQLRLGYSIGLGESTISRIFRFQHTPQKSTLHSIWLGLKEWKDFLENDKSSE
tara:strand:+ start:2341 stop:2631 length:291 start_codon:yes stop_codon:yes gene_type:complete